MNSWRLEALKTESGLRRTRRSQLKYDVMIYCKGAVTPNALRWAPSFGPMRLRRMCDLYAGDVQSIHRDVISDKRWRSQFEAGFCAVYCYVTV
jgi:hypothetical protein